jgi:hypothetical protein
MLGIYGTTVMGPKGPVHYGDDAGGRADAPARMRMTVVCGLPVIRSGVTKTVLLQQ